MYVNFVCLCHIDKKRLYPSFFIAYSLCSNLFLQKEKSEDENEDKKVFLSVTHTCHSCTLYCTCIPRLKFMHRRSSMHLLHYLSTVLCMLHLREVADFCIARACLSAFQQLKKDMAAYKV